MRVPVRRRQKRFRAALACLAALTLLLWHVGLLDHLFETSFTAFRWPPFVNVRQQVDLELNHEASSYLYENDWGYFAPRKLPSCGISEARNASSDRFILIVVKSAAQNIANRDAIRSTWGAVRGKGEYTVRTVFAVGELHAEEQTKMGDVLSKESDQHQDLIIGDFVDAYRNNTLKFLSAVQLSYAYCSKVVNAVAFALFIDDDYFLSIDELIAEVQTHQPNENLYMGWRFDTSPFRFTFHKHRVALAAYPFDQYPPYISAGAVLLSRRTIEELYHGIQHVRLFPYDDIYAGIVTHLLGIPPQHNPRMLFWAPHPSPPPRTICAHGFATNHLLLLFNQLSHSHSL